MSDHSYQHPTTRRQFFTIVGAAAGVAIAHGYAQPAAAQGAAAPATFRQAAQPITVGLLLPRAAQHPRLAASLHAGMQFHSVASASALRVHAAEIPAGRNAVAALEQLITDHAPDVVVSIANPAVAAGFSPLLAAHQRCLLLGGVGANITRDDEQSPWVLDGQLPHWKAAYAAGQWAAQNVGKRAVLAHSFYESGYDAQYAFRCGFEQAGGAVAATLTTHVPGVAADVRTTLAQIAEARPDVVYASYCGAEAVEWLHTWAATPALRDVQLLAAGCMLDEAVLAQAGPAARGVRSVVPQARDLRAGSPPDQWALLGANAARQITALAARVHGAWHDPDVVQDAWRTLQASRMPQPFVVRAVQRRGTRYDLVPVATLAAAPQQDAQITALRASMRTGWTHPYLLS